MPLPRLVCAFALLAGLLPVLSASRKSEWDLPGEKFKGTPSEAIGPLAVFQTGSLSGRMALFGGWKPEDYQRFADEIATQPARADRWSDAKGEVTSEIGGRASQLENGKLVPVDFTRLPEPDLLLVFYASSGDGPSWNMVSQLTEVYRHIQQVYPGRVGGLFYGVRHNASDQKNMATAVGMPWLVADFASEPEMHRLSRFAPGEGRLALLITRDGTPLIGVNPEDDSDLTGFVDHVARVLAALNPANPHMWRGRMEFGRVLRARAAAALPPELIANALRLEILRKYGVKRIEAHLQISADGKVTEATLLPGTEMPTALQPGIREALPQQLLLLPAVDHGREIAGELTYQLDVPPADPVRDARLAWFGGEAVHDLPITSWLLLRPVHVTEKDFGEDHVDANGVVVLRPMSVIDSGVTRESQMDAFHSDWFASSGAAAVHPAEGDTVTINGATLRWERSKPDNGYVDLQRGLSRLDYCIGYAWTEVEVPADTDAWLGIGSDDGMKIWLNGELVNDKWVRRPSRIDNDIVPLHLHKGKNQLLLKIQNAIGDWSFICRLRTAG